MKKTMESGQANISFFHCLFNHHPWTIWKDWFWWIFQLWVKNIENFKNKGECLDCWLFFFFFYFFFFFKSKLGLMTLLVKNGVIFVRLVILKSLTPFDINLRIEECFWFFVILNLGVANGLMMWLSLNPLL